MQLEEIIFLMSEERNFKKMFLSFFQHLSINSFKLNLPTISVRHYCFYIVDSIGDLTLNFFATWPV